MLMTHVQQNLSTYELREWFDELCEQGPKYGYHPNAENCIILIVDANHEAEARSVFEHLRVKVVKGYRFLKNVVASLSRGCHTPRRERSATKAGTLSRSLGSPLTTGSLTMSL